MAWYAYDFGNTSVEFAIPLYLTVWIVSDLGVDARLFGLASALSSWAIALSGPYIGVHADEHHSRRLWFSLGVAVAAMLLGSLVFLPTQGTGCLAAVVLAAMTANYFFQLSSLIYNASLLAAAKDANVVSVSSLGIALSFLGGAAGVGVMELLLSGRLIPGVTGRDAALALAALIFVICALPGALTGQLWKQRGQVLPSSQESLHRRMRRLWAESSRRHRAGWFLAGYFLMNSSIMGLTLYLPLYVRNATGLDGVRLLAAVASVVLASAIGAGAVALLRPDQARTRRIVLVGLTLLGLNSVAFGLVSALPLVVLCACLHGLLSGALVPSVRGAFALIFPPDYQALAFGLFGAVQRISQGLGAALWPLAESASNGQSAALGVIAMGLLALTGVPPFQRWRQTAEVES